MKLHRSFNPRFAPILWVPVVDVAAALIFFFLLSGTFLLQPGIAVQVPASPFFLGPQHEPRIVAITSAPRPGIYFENQRITPDELRGRLAERRAGERTIIIKADQDSPVELLVAVSNVALEEGYTVVLATAPEP